MKVLLIYPAFPKPDWPRGIFRSHWVPTGLAYIATALRRAGHDVRVHVREQQLARTDFDWNRADAVLDAELRRFAPEMVGLSVLTPAMPEAGETARCVKRLCGDSTLIVAGGVHPTALPERTLEECPAIDAVAVGEGEATLTELADRGLSGDVAGLVFRSDGGVVRTPPRPAETDLDALGMPAYDLFDMDFFTRRNRWMIRWLPLKVANVRTSRGCPNRCRFCAGHVASGVGVRFHSLDHVMEQIHRAVGEYDVEAIHFEDDTMGADPHRLSELCGRLRRDGLSDRIVWDCCLRVDQADGELLDEMRAAGCIQIEYGFESGSDATLRRLAKNASDELNRRAVRLTRQAGIRIFADIMIGLPGETADDFRATVRFLRQARPEVISASVLYPLPGTALFEQLDDETRRRIDWGCYCYLDSVEMPWNFTAMPRERFAELHRKFFKYVVRPQQTRALLRDARPDERDFRRRLRRRFTRFALRHPIRAARLP